MTTCLCHRRGRRVLTSGRYGSYDTLTAVIAGLVATTDGGEAWTALELVSALRLAR